MSNAKRARAIEKRAAKHKYNPKAKSPHAPHPRGRRPSGEGFSFYLRRIMHKVNVPHDGVLSGSQSFTFLTSRNGLVATKIARIRTTMVKEKPAIAEGFDVIAKQFATLSTAPENATEEELAAFVPKPIVIRGASPAQSDEDKKAGKPSAEGQEQFYQLSGTKAYKMSDESLKQFEQAQEKFMKETIELNVPELTEADMAAITYQLPDGREIGIPGIVMDVLMHFAPTL